MKVALFDFLARNKDSQQIISDSNDSFTYAKLSDQIAKATFLAAHSGIGPGAICSFVADHSIKSLITILSLFRIGALAVPLQPQEKDKMTAIQNELGVCFHLKNDRWIEVEGVEPFIWSEPPGPGIIHSFQNDKNEYQFIFFSEKKLIDISTATSKIQKLSDSSIVSVFNDLSTLEGAILQTLPALIAGAGMRFLELENLSCEVNRININESDLIKLIKVLRQSDFSKFTKGLSISINRTSLDHSKNLQELYQFNIETCEFINIKKFGPLLYLDLEKNVINLEDFKQLNVNTKFHLLENRIVLSGEIPFSNLLVKDGILKLQSPNTVERIFTA